MLNVLIRTIRWPLLLFIFTLLFYQLCNWSNFVSETIYHGGFFTVIRIIYDYTIGFLPFAFLYLFVFILICYLFFKILKRRKKQEPLRIRISHILGSSINFILIVLSLFYWSWGYNYTRPTIENKLNFQRVKVDEEQLFTELNDIIDTLTSIRNQINQDTFSIIPKILPAEYEKTIRSELESTLKMLEYNVFGRPRVRILAPKGTLLHWSTAGVYIPFVFEGHVDGGLHPVVWPFTMAHEMTHGYGVTDEGECNFIALLACIDHPDLEVQYSGWLSYARYIMSNARMVNRKRYTQFFPSIAKGIINDLSAIYAYSDRYTEYLPALRDFIYDSYLKSHGVREGLQSYSRIIQLNFAFKKWQSSKIGDKKII